MSLCVCAKSLQSCLTLSDPMDCLPGSSFHGILQARILEWVAMPASRGSSCPRGRTQVCGSWVAGGFLIGEPPMKPLLCIFSCAFFSDRSWSFPPMIVLQIEVILVFLWQEVSSRTFYSIILAHLHIIFFENYFTYSGIFVFHIHFKISLCLKKSFLIFFHLFYIYILKELTYWVFFFFNLSQHQLSFIWVFTEVFLSIFWFSTSLPWTYFLGFITEYLIFFIVSLNCTVLLILVSTCLILLYRDVLTLVCWY